MATKIQTSLFKQVRGFDYEVSNTGDIKSLPKSHIQTYKTGKKAIHTTRERILKKRHDSKGYNTCILYKNGRTFCKKVHRLVAEAFLPNPKKYPQINHKNGIKDDNRVENLEWCDNSYNQKHAIKIGLRKNTSRGEDNNLSKLTERDVKRIRMALKCGIQRKELEKIFKVSKPCITAIATNRNWKHVKLNIV